jgi:predicted DNA binding CopG/RHH family protein
VGGSYNDVTQYFDPSKMVVARLTHLKPSTTSISLRLSDSLLDGIRQQANKLDVPYQSLMKIWLTEKLREQGGCTDPIGSVPEHTDQCSGLAWRLDLL